MGLRDWFKPAPKSQETRIIFDTNGLSVSRQAVGVSEVTSLRWDQILWAVAYKKDCFAYDDIRAEFSGGPHGNILISESDEGFHELLGALPVYLPGIMEDWYLREVAAPAFETTPMKIYERSE